MKPITLTIVFMLFIGSLFGQQRQLLGKVNAGLKSVTQPPHSSSHDTVKQIVVPDSVQAKITERPDSITHSIIDSLAKARSLLQVSSQRDTVNALQEELKTLLVAKEDSLKRKLVILQRKQKVDSVVSTEYDSLGNILRQAYSVPVDKSNLVQDQITQGLEKRVDSLQSMLQIPDSTGIDKFLKTDTNFSSTGFEQLKNIPDLKPNELSSLKGTSALPSLPTMSSELAPVSELGLNTESYKINGIDGVNTAVDISTSDRDKVKGLEKLNGDLQSQQLDKKTIALEEVDGKTHASDHLASIEKLKVDSAHIEKKAEEELLKSKALSKVNLELEKVTKFQKEQQDLIMHKGKDRKQLLADLTKKSDMVANDLVVKKADQVKEAQSTLSKANSLTPKSKGFTNPFVSSSTFKKMKTYQRLVPGITGQVCSGYDVYVVDLSLQIGYKLTPNIVMGVGGLSRIGVDEKINEYVKSIGVSGGRIYTSMAFFKGTFVHGETEMLRIKQSRMVGLTKNDFSTGIVCGNFGLGRTTRLTRRVNASVLALYRVEYEGTLPSAKKINIRLGVELDLSKRSRRTLINRNLVENANH
jgi:hypothetical protein